MNLESKSPNEIQQEIFGEIRNGTSIEKLKAELKEKGLHPEGYYFATETEHNKVMEEPKTAAGQMSGWQIFIGIVAVLVLVLRIARCSSKM